MKKITLSLIAMISLNTLSFAGGDIRPVEPYVNIPDVQENTLGKFYAGLGYSYMNMNTEAPEEDYTANAVLFKGGYNFNEYFGVEGRYTMNVGDITYDNGAESDIDADMSNIGIYAKGMYPVMDKFTVYGLLGFGQVTFDDGVAYKESGFQWGLGAEYALYENIGMFVDYTNLYNDTGFDGAEVNRDVMVDVISVGVNYTF